jgi:hypothetical protein
MATLAVPAPAAADHVYALQWGTPGPDPGQLNDANGIDTDRFDNVYVADFGNHRIQKFSPDGELITQWGTEGSGNGQFMAPRDVTVHNSSGDVYVADRVANRIQKFQADGTFVWARNGTTGAGQFDQPSGVATDAAGNVYVTDRVANRVQKFNSSGDFVAAFGAGQMSLPTGIDVSTGGTVYVANEGTDVVQRWDTSGVLSGSFDGSGVANGGNPAFANPIDVSVSSETGKVFVVDDAGNSVEQFSSTGTYEFKWDAAGSDGGEFATPQGVATGTLDRFFVTDLDNGRIQRFDGPIDGSVVRTSGTRLVFEADSGDANVVVISQSGSDYTVTDTGNTPGTPPVPVALTGGGGCTVTSGIASCSSTTGITSIRATLLDGIDSIAISGTTPAALDGGSGNDTLTGADGDDTLTGGAGDDALTGGGGNSDVVSYSGAGTGVTVNLSNSGAQSTGGAGTDTIVTVEGVTGSAQSDTLTGNGSANSLSGGAGNNDLLNGAGGDDTLDGGDGTGDRVTYFDATAGVTVSLASSSGQSTGGSGTDTLSGFEDLTGSDHGDTLTAGTGVNDIVCLEGADTVMAHMADTVAADCDNVTRIDGAGGAPPPGTGTGGGTTAPATPGTTPAATAPVISSLTVPKMRSGRAGTFSYSLDKAAKVTIAIDQARPGRKDGRTCKKQTRKNRKKRACTLFAAIGKLSQPGHAGRNTLRFSGKLNGGKLKPGRYRATAVGTAASGKSAPATANFVVSR